MTRCHMTVVGRQLANSLSEAAHTRAHRRLFLEPMIFEDVIDSLESEQSPIIVSGLRSCSRAHGGGNAFVWLRML